MQILKIYIFCSNYGGDFSAANLQPYLPGLHKTRLVPTIFCLLVWTTVVSEQSTVLWSRRLAPTWEATAETLEKMTWEELGVTVTMVWVTWGKLATDVYFEQFL